MDAIISVRFGERVYFRLCMIWFELLTYGEVVMPGNTVQV